MVLNLQIKLLSTTLINFSDVIVVAIGTLKQIFCLWILEKSSARTAVAKPF